MIAPHASCRRRAAETHAIGPLWAECRLIRCWLCYCLDDSRSHSDLRNDSSRSLSRRVTLHAVGGRASGILDVKRPTVKSFLTGIVVGSLAMYVAFQSHLVRYNGGVTLVPKNPAIPLTDTFADIRDWSASDWEKHPRLLAAVKTADRVDLIRESTEESSDETPDDQMQPESPSERPGKWLFGSPSSSGTTEVSPTSQVDLGATSGEIPPPIDVYAEAVDEDERRRSPRGADNGDSGPNGFLDQLDRAYWESRQDAEDAVKSRARSSIEDAVDSMFEAVDSASTAPPPEPVRASQQPAESAAQ